MSLQGKRILLGVTGSIAAYKAAHLIRLLVKEGAEVQTIVSASALDFITPLTLATLSKNPVAHEFHDLKTGEWKNHVELGLWADLFLIAPLSANTLAKFANGHCDNLLTAVYLSARCPVMVAPAMDLDMYQHPSVKNNLHTLRTYGNVVLDAEKGELASGLSGQGRMREPEQILLQIIQHFDIQKELLGKKFLITAGPTYEAIDPVRFIGNHSSGKMGVAIAEAVAQRGGDVVLILGPSALDPVHPRISTVRVTSAAEMYQAASSYHAEMDCCVFAAAVSDYRPVSPAKEKIKKEEEEMMLSLQKNPDIAGILGEAKQHGQIHVGFALETSNEHANALGKLNKKNFDMVVLNSLNDEGAGFQHDTNNITLFFRNATKVQSGLKSKKEIAEMIVVRIKNLFHL